MKKIITIIAFALLSFNAFSADINATQNKGNSLNSAAVPNAQSCSRAGDGFTIVCDSLQSLPGLAYTTMRTVDSELTSFGCYSLGSGASLCPGSSSLSQAYSANNMYVLFTKDKNGYLSSIYFIIM